jgi:hypothetical protein
VRDGGPVEPAPRDGGTRTPWDERIAPAGDALGAPALRQPAPTEPEDEAATPWVERILPPAHEPSTPVLREPTPTEPAADDADTHSPWVERILPTDHAPTDLGNAGRPYDPPTPEADADSATSGGDTSDGEARDDDARTGTDALATSSAGPAPTEGPDIAPAADGTAPAPETPADVADTASPPPAPPADVPDAAPASAPASHGHASPTPAGDAPAGRRPIGDADRPRLPVRTPGEQLPPSSSPRRPVPTAAPASDEPGSASRPAASAASGLVPPEETVGGGFVPPQSDTGTSTDADTGTDDRRADATAGTPAGSVAEAQATAANGHTTAAEAPAARAGGDGDSARDGDAVDGSEAPDLAGDQDGTPGAGGRLPAAGGPRRREQPPVAGRTASGLTKRTPRPLAGQEGDTTPQGDVLGTLQRYGRPVRDASSPVGLTPAPSSRTGEVPPPPAAGRPAAGRRGTGQPGGLAARLRGGGRSASGAGEEAPSVWASLNLLSGATPRTPRAPMLPANAAPTGEPERTASGLTRRVPGAHLPTAGPVILRRGGGGATETAPQAPAPAPRPTTPPEDLPAPTVELSRTADGGGGHERAETVYTLLTSFAVGVQRGLDETAANAETPDR